MLEEILLDDPARSKLGIYKHILEIDPGEYPIHYFEKYTGYSHIKTANLLQGMNKELQELSGGSRLLNEKDKVVVAKVIPSYQQYQQYLFSRGVPYGVLLESLLHPDKDLKDFGTMSGLSQSSLMRRLKPLVEYLKFKGIRLNCLQMEVTGRESAIRIMYFNFLWSVDFGTKLYGYFENELQQSLDSFLSADDLVYLKYVEKREFSMYHGISLLRTRQGYYVDEPQINQLLFPATNRKFKEALEAEKVPETYQEREANFVNYMIFYWPQIFATDDPRLPIIKRQYKLLDESKGYAVTFFEGIKKELNIIGRGQQELLLLNLQTIFLRRQILGGNVPKNLDFIMESLKKQHPEFEVLAGRINDTLSEIVPADEDLVSLLTIVCINAFHNEGPAEKVNIGIIGFPNHFLLYAMINRIERLPFVEFSLMNSSSLENYDAVITCSKELLPKNTKNYWIVEGEASFDDMDNYLFQLYKEKTV